MPGLFEPLALWTAVPPEAVGGHASVTRNLSFILGEFVQTKIVSGFSGTKFRPVWGPPQTGEKSSSDTAE